LKSYLIDVPLMATMRLNANTPEEAVLMAEAAFDCAWCNGGAWPSGDPILFEAYRQNDVEIIDED